MGSGSTRSRSKEPYPRRTRDVLPFEWAGRRRTTLRTSRRRQIGSARWRAIGGLARRRQGTHCQSDLFVNFEPGDVDVHGFSLSQLADRTRGPVQVPAAQLIVATGGRSWPRAGSPRACHARSMFPPKSMSCRRGRSGGVRGAKTTRKSAPMANATPSRTGTLIRFIFTSRLLDPSRLRSQNQAPNGTPIRTPAKTTDHSATTVVTS